MAGRWGAVALMLVSPACGMAPELEKTDMTEQSGTDAGQATLKRIGLTLPASARIEHAEQIPGQDNAVRVIAVLTEAEWASVTSHLTGAGGEKPVFSADDNFHLGPDADSWKPSAAQGLKTAQLPWGKGRESLNLGIAPAESGQVRLFVFWHQL